MNSGERPKVAGFFSPPVFPGNEDKTTAAAMVHYGIVFGVCANVLAIPPMIMAGDPLWRIGLTIGMLFGLLFLHAIALRRGYVLASAVVFGISAWLALAYINLTAGGVLAPGYSTHMVLIISIGFILGGRGAIVTATASTLLGFAFIGMQKKGFLPVPAVENTPERYWLLAAMNFAAAASIMTLMMRRLNTTIADGRREVAARREAERNLEAHQERLEGTVRMRTEALERSNHALIRENQERREAEQTLQRERDFIGSLMETSPAGILTLDDQGRINFVNAAAGKILGIDRLELERTGGVALNWRAANQRGDVVPGAAPPFAAVLAGGEPMSGVSVSVETLDGRTVLLSVNAVPFGEHAGRPGRVVMAIEDVTDRARREHELLKTQKLESVGVLAGGIAHDFNNLLAVVLGNVSLARLEVPAESSAASDLGQAEQALLQARELTQQLLTFSRGGAPVMREIDVGAIAVRSVQFALHGTSTRADLEVPAELWPVWGDEGQIGQVFHNIALNACQAMPEGGTIVLRAANVVGSDVPILTQRADHYVRISIADDGPGIPGENLSRIFDPYFTTKEGGSGLGLAVAYSVVKNHAGLIDVDSKPGEGSTFTIYLPAAPAVRSGALDTAGSSDGNSDGRRILVMDDEPLMRELLGRMLRSLGYAAEITADGTAALEAFRRSVGSEHPFDAVILDLTVPGGMGGTRTVELLRELDPAVKAIVSSGYSDDPVMSKCSDFGFCAVLAKPFQVAGLSAVLKKVLG